ncbi:FemAB family XrtA/PEP-CTERM system-associated protein [Arhodomonas sp. SL1]|uniref:FemAB family XrtA/PEP-CTERM system-associated protein n=1 Tax=Arhodomonas sp. SL1 TaxID=3425691 RepID=UPI003F88453C
MSAHSPTVAAAAAVRVVPFAAAGDALWDAFVLGHPEGSFFHRSGWRTVIERTFGHQTHYLTAVRDGELVGVLPLARVSSWLFGDALISLPFCAQCGPLVVDDAVATALDDAAVELAEGLGVGHLEYRLHWPRHQKWPRKRQYVGFRGPIAESSEAAMAAIPRKQRAMVRKGMQAGLEPRVDADVTTCHRVYAESVHRLGTPVFPRRYFRMLREVFGEDCDVLTVIHSGQPVASVLSFYFREEVLPYYGGGTDFARAVAGNDYLYWALMEHARARGCRVFDFGRSKVDSGSYHFKRHWGFEPEPLHYECRLVRAREIPDNSPLNPRYQCFIRVWRRLPRGVVNTLGPHIVRNLG